MVGNESSSEVSSGGGNNPFIVIHNDEIGKSITAVKLNCANYLAWSKSIKVVLRAKKKLKFLLEDLPPETTVDYEDWMRADAYVMSWLWYSMELYIASNVHWCETAKLTWTSLKESYSKKRHVACIYELYKLLFTTKQNKKSVNEYLANKALWEELLQYHSV